METTATEIINGLITEVQNIRDKEIQKIELLAAKKIHESNLFLFKLQDLTKVLTKLHLRIEKIYLHKTGINSNVWNEGDQFNFDLTCKSIDGKFKFIKEAGYLKSGRNRNFKVLEGKSKRMTDEIKTVGFTSVSVNQFSLEADEFDNRSVLISITI